ncbi:hypothetical protein SVIO_088100 [Streptomyces violaceusniger]|uniref:Uncharacterized protein n=1 Tax=Streptomyces violaceusniger TaxID=68280 RepID=A0A4D4LIE8_STRVO|nr:hypothetical protein SVIO_088100 [Streptomyces violaceusniger]
MWYIRSPPPVPYGQATNRSAVSPGRAQYPRATPHPATYNSPTTPTGTNPNPASSTNTREFGTGEPIGTEVCAAPSECHTVA